MKRYWEITVDQFPGSIGQGDDGLWCGLASSTAIPSSYVIGQDASSVGYNQIYAHLGAFGKIISDNGVTTIDTNAYGVSDVICCALDDVANLYWTQTIAGATWNAGGAANPATGVGGISLSGPGSSGPYYAAVSMNVNAGTGQVTLNVGASAFAGTVPAGFSAYDSSGITTWDLFFNPGDFVLTGGNLIIASRATGLEDVTNTSTQHHTAGRRPTRVMARSGAP